MQSKTKRSWDTVVFDNFLATVFDFGTKVCSFQRRNICIFLRIFLTFPRSFTQIRRDLFDPLDFIQTVLLAFIVGFLWYNIPMDVDNITNRLGAMFFFATFMAHIRPSYQAVLFCMKTIPAVLFLFLSSLLFFLTLLVPSERAVVLRERRSGAYRLSAYYLAKITSSLPVVNLHPFLFFCIVYPMVSFSAEFSRFILLLVIVLISVLTADAMGTMVSTMTAPDAKKGAVVNTIFILSYVVFFLLGKKFAEKICQKSLFLML